MLRVLIRLHSQHILHRDIKPENIFLSGRRSLILGDFGLAIRGDEELPFTRSGTLDYMAPEVCAPWRTTMIVEASPLIQVSEEVCVLMGLVSLTRSVIVTK